MRRSMIALAVIALVATTIACSESAPESAPTAEPTEVTEEEATEAEVTEPDVTEAPSETPEPTEAATDTATPTETPQPTEPSYSEPVEVVTVEGVGETVTDNYEFPECFKAVFDWHVDQGSYGSASLILKLHNVATRDEMTLVNEFGEAPEGLDGKALQPLLGGEYFFSSQNTDEAWRVTLLCENNVAPVAGEELAFEGQGNTVSGNYELPECSKSVFSYSVEPNNTGAASLILYLCSADRRDCTSIANKFEMDLIEPLEGKVVEALRGGIYFLATENASGNDWQITWECQD